MPASGGERLLLALLVAVVVALAALPFARLVAEATIAGGQADLGPLRRALEAPGTWRATRNTLEVGLGGTLVATGLGASFALLVALTDVRAKGALVFAFMLPLTIAPQVIALAWSQTLGPQSVLLRALGLAPAPGAPNPLHSREGIILLLGLQQAPLVFLALRAGLRALPRELVEAARGGGAGPWRVLATIVLPLVAPALLAGVSLAFVAAIGNFGIPALLGIPGRYTVLTTLIYQRLAGLGPAVLAEVAALSLLLGLMAVAGVAVQGWAAARRDVRVVPLGLGAPVWRLGRWRAPVELGCWIGLGFLVLAPLVALVAASLVPAQGVALSRATATLAAYTFVLVEHAPTRRALVNSTALAGSAAALLTLLTVPLGYFLAWRRTRLLRGLAVLAELPFALPGVVLAIAMILVFLRPLPLLGWSLYNTPWIILIAYLARFLALSLRPVLSGYQQLDRSLEEAARMAGAELGYRLRTVVWPLVAPVAAAGALLVFLTAFSELTVSALLWSVGVETLGVVVFSLDQAGDAVSAAAVAVLSVAGTLGAMLAATLLGRRLPAGALPWRA
jgi:iron(III) transport system permease protein